MTIANDIAVSLAKTRVRKRRQPKPSHRLLVETLEDRVTPSLLGAFELDRDATTTASHDWDQVFADNNMVPPPSSQALASAFVTDLFNSNADDIFTGGGSKDYLGLQNGPWLFTDSKPQAKNDITHAYAAAYTDPSNGHLLLYTGMDRFDNSGDATAGFWFFQNSIGLSTTTPTNSGSRFVGTHTDGDILLVSDFTQGGSTSEIKVFRWTGDDSTGGLAAVTVLAGTTHAIVNGASTLVPWSFTDKSHNTAPAAGEFLEQGVDLTALGLDGKSFRSFLAETRSSQSPTATLNDFVLGSFPLVNASVVATPFSALSAVGASVDYPLTVTNTGAVPLYLQNLSDTLLGNIVVNGVVQAPVAPVTAIDASGLSAGGSLAPGASLTIFVSRTAQPTDANPTLNTVTFVFNDRANFSGAQVSASVTDSVRLATFADFLGYLASIGGADNQGIANSLEAKARNAAAAYEAGNYNAAKGMLGAFINEVQAQRGKKLTLIAADQLLAYASLLLEQLP